MGERFLESAEVHAIIRQAGYADPSEYPGPFVFPPDVVAIGIGAFENLHSLVSIEIPYTVVFIMADAFKNCRSLVSLTRLCDIEHVPSGFCKGCTSLKSIVIPEGVISIGHGAFEDCVSLVAVDLPFTYDGEDIAQAFRGCTNIFALAVPSFDLYPIMEIWTTFQRANIVIVKYPDGRLEVTTRNSPEALAGRRALRALVDSGRPWNRFSIDARRTLELLPPPQPFPLQYTATLFAGLPNRDAFSFLLHEESQRQARRDALLNLPVRPRLPIEVVEMILDVHDNARVLRVRYEQARRERDRLAIQPAGDLYDWTGPGSSDF